MLGDTAIAVHPDDVRYQHLVGSQATHPFSGRMVPIIADEFVDREKGTGAVKLTPAHSSVDYQIAVKHNLRHINILSDDGTLCNCGEVFDGMKRFDAREKVAQILQKKGLWRGQTSHPMSVPICSRSSDIIEPKLKEQWFLDCSDMAMDAIQAAEDSDIEFIPSYYSKLWKHFLTQTREIPWCISRQLWWGHNIPAYKLLSDSNSKLNGQYVVAPTFTEAITKATEMLGHNKFKLVQDEDVLDTWFSSSLLPFASLGWPVQNPNLMTFYPTTMVESGSDILFFWIARMVMLGKKLTGNPPFRQILIHSLLLSHGEKMSKSKGNVIDPMSIIQGCSLEELQKSLESSNIDRKEMAAIFAEQKKQFSSGIPECGSDALRMALCSYDFKGASINIEVETFVEYRSLCNKIWQIFKFYQNYFPNGFIASNIDQVNNLSAKDCWILDKCAHLTELCAQHFPKANLDVITYSLKRHWAVDFSTIYLEYSKPTLQHGTAQEKEIALSVAVKVMDMSLKCLSPFMPYLSEELYQRLPLPNKAPSICVASFPSTHEWSIFRNHTMNDDFEKMFKLSSSIKNFKAQFGLLHQSKRVGTAYIIGPLRQGIPLEVLHLIEHDARLTSLQVDKMPDESNSVCNLEVLQPNYTVLVDLSDSIRSQSEEELEKMSGKLHKLLVSQRQLLDETLRLDQTSLDGADLQSHNSKVADLKKELTTAEKCVEYVINVTNGSNL
ncbi:VARS2 [Bugula neritina]|uniref:valine--tRNA ligase n=1 Tax=Bugula neritina TaxID=10212 RepID=A0A7J7KK97_BUGNE|nr:VARS2 [Bugula neritina]